MANIPETPGSGSGTDIYSIGIGADTQPLEKLVDKLDQAAVATIGLEKGLGNVTIGGRRASEALSKFNEKAQAQILAVMQEVQAFEQLEKATKDLHRAQDALAEQSSAFIVKLDEMVKTFGMSNEALLRHKASLLEVSEAAEPYIVQLEQLRIKADQKAIGQKRDIELMQMQAQEERELARAMTERQTLVEKRDVELWQMRGQQHNDYIKWWEQELLAQEKLAANYAKMVADETAVASKAAAERQALVEKRDMETYLMRERHHRDYIRWWEEELALQEASASAATLANEKAAIDEINWANKTLKAKIDALQKLQQYQSNSAITPGTIEKTFGAAALKDLPNLTKYLDDYNEQLANTVKGHAAAAHGAEAMINPLNGARVATSTLARETLVLGREISAGNWTRFAGSLTIFTQALGFTLNPITLLIAGIAGVAYEVTKGSIEFDKLNEALIITGNYAGTTADGLNSIAHEATAMGGSIGSAKKAVLELANAGRFTSDEISLITEASINMERATGQSIDKTIQEFETLAAKSSITARNHDEVTKAALNLDEKYHFLTTSIIDQIAKLEEEGKVREAARLAMEAYANTINGRVPAVIDNLSYVARAWNWIKREVGGALDKLNEWGKPQTAGSNIRNLTEQIKEIDAGTFGNVHDKAVQNRRAEAVRQLTAAQAQFNKEQQQSNDIGERTRTQSEAVHAQARIREEDMKARKHSMTELQVKMEEYHNQLSLLRKDSSDEMPNPLLSEEAIKKHEDMLKKLYGPKAGPKEKKPENDGRMIALRSLLDEFQAEYDVTKRATEENEKLLRKEYQNQLIDSETYYGTVKILREEEVKALEDVNNKKLGVMSKYVARTKVDAEQIKKMQTDQTIAFTKARDSIEDKQTSTNQDQRIEESNKIKAMIDNVVKGGEKETQQLNHKIELQEQYNAKALGGEEAKLSVIKAQNDEKANQAESDANYLDGLIKSGQFEGASLAVYQARLKVLRDEVALRQRYSMDLGIGSKIQEENEATKLLNRQLEQALQHAQKFEKGMKAAFGNVGDSIGGMVVALAEFDKRQQQIVVNRQQAMKAAGDDPEKQRLALMQEEQDNLDNQLDAYVNLTNAAKNLFDKESTAYKVMDGISKAVQLTQSVLMLSELALNNPTTLAVIAALTAFSAMFGNGRVTNGQFAKEVVQKNQGTGSVLGDITAKSQSLNKALDIVAKNSDSTMPISQDMLKSLKSIDSSMKGLANAISRSLGLTGGETLGIPVSSVSKTLGGIWGKTTRDLVDSGIAIQKSSYADLVKGLGAQAFATIKETSSSWFGLVKDTNYSRQFGNLDPKTATMLGKVFSGTVDTLSKSSEALGFDKNRMYNNAVGATASNYYLSTRDLKGQELQDAIDSFFSKMADDLAHAVMPGLDDFQKVGEGYSETVVRMANEIDKANSVLGKFNINAINYRDIIDKQGDIAFEIVQQSIHNAETFNGSLSGVGKIMDTVTGSVDDLAQSYKDLLSVQKQMRLLNLGEISQDLINGAGGTKELSNALGVYQDKFFTDQQKAAILWKDLQQDFAKMNIALPKDRDNFRTLVDQLQKQSNDPNARKLLGQILGLADTFDKAVSASDALNGSVLDLTNSWKVYSDRFFSDQEKSDKMWVEISKSFSAINVAMPNTREEFRKLVEKLQNDTSPSAQALLDKVIALSEGFDSAVTSTENLKQQVVSKWQSIGDSIIDEVNRIRGVVQQSGSGGYAATLASFASTTAQARSGDADAAGRLVGLSQTLTQLAETNAHNATELNTMRMATANSLEETAKVLSEKYGIKLKGYAEGGDPMGGFYIAGERGKELINTGPARVFSAQQTRAILSGNQGSELNALRAEVKMLRPALEAIATTNQQMKDILRRNDTGLGLLVSNTLPK